MSILDSIGKDQIPLSELKVESACGTIVWRIDANWAATCALNGFVDAEVNGYLRRTVLRLNAEDPL
jgi:hypothetical protein